LTASPGTVFRLILEQPADGQWNMAVDEALLESVGAGEGQPSVRLYGFSPPTLSFGRFQRIRDRLLREAVQAEGVTLVRRPTGGQAVLHDGELTYSVVLGREHLEPFRKREIYRFIAELLLEGLKRLGVRGHSTRTRTGDPHNPDCFRSTGEYEIASAAAKKLIGSAQVVTRGASLQHGAIPLDVSYSRIGRYLALAAGERPDKPASLGGELGRTLSFQDAAAAFAAGFDSGLHHRGLKLANGGLTDFEHRRAGQLLQSKYTRDEWNLMY
jgi:lipoate-protein ligase A